MHPIRREINRRTGKKMSGRQWRKLRKLEGYLTNKQARLADYWKNTVRKTIRRSQ